MLTRKLQLTIIILLIITGLYLLIQFNNLQQELAQAKSVLKSHETNDDILNFTQLFIDEVLQAEAEVDFETRLRLENSVRALDNAEILDQWQEFIDSKTESAAQENATLLLDLLIDQIKR